MPVPDDKKDSKYWERRKKNNQAAKKSRNLRKKKMDDELKSAKEAIQENQKLKQEIDVSLLTYTQPFTHVNTSSFSDEWMSITFISSTPHHFVHLLPHHAGAES